MTGRDPVAGGDHRRGAASIDRATTGGAVVGAAVGSASFAHVAPSSSDREPTGQVAGLILAAGSARRFGATKQLARVGGRPLVGHAVETAHAGGLTPVVVVVGHDGDAVAAAARGAGPVVVVTNPAHGDGQATSLRAGLEAVRDRGADGAVVLLADEPDVPVAAVTAVAGRLDAHHPVVRVRYDDGPGHPVGLHRSTFARLDTVTGDRGARDLLADALEVSIPGPRPRDIDTPEDLASRRP